MFIYEFLGTRVWKWLQKCSCYPLCQGSHVTHTRGHDKEVQTQKSCEGVHMPSKGKNVSSRGEILFPVSTEANMWTILPYLVVLIWKKLDFHLLTKFLKNYRCHPKVVMLKETVVTYQKNKSTILEKDCLIFLFSLQKIFQKHLNVLRTEYQRVSSQKYRWKVLQKSICIKWYVHFCNVCVL